MTLSNLAGQLSSTPPARHNRRPRPSLLRLSLSRITGQRRQPKQRSWVWSCVRRALSTRLVLLLLGWLIVRILYHHAGSVLALVRDPTTPTTFFKTYRIGDKEVLLRSWRKPHVFTPFSDATKQFTRTQPIPELQRGPRPSSYPCMKDDGAPLLFVGVFSTASRWSRRDLLRAYRKPKTALINGKTVEFKFILGQPKLESDRQSLEREMQRHDDIVVLDQEENMNDGKTYAFFQWLAKRSGPKPHFAFKVDDDTLLVLRNLLPILDKLDCNNLYYLGSCIDRTCGLNRGFPYYFTGMAYGLSAPLYQWIGNANVTRKRARGLEDVRTSTYLLNLKENKGEKLIRLNFDGRMGDWKYSHGPEWQFDPKTVIALHGMKKEEILKRVQEKLERGRGANRVGMLDNYRV